MHRFSFVSLAVLFAVPAMAQETTESVADVAFEAEQVLFRGADEVIRFPSVSASPIGFQFTANVSADAVGVMEAQSVMVWPDAMTQSWEGVAGGGEMAADVALALDAAIVLDGVISVAGFSADFTGNSSCSATFCSVPITYSLWSQTTDWSATAFFDSLLLPGSPQQSVSIGINRTNNSDEIFGWSPGDALEFGLPFGDYTVSLTGDVAIEPASVIQITGQSVTTRGRSVEVHDGSVIVPAPGVNDGTASFESVWAGEVTSTFAVVPSIEPTIDILDGDGVATSFGPTITSIVTGALNNFLGSRFTWEIASDTRPFRSKNTEYTHDLPAIDTDQSSLDFGSILIETESQLNLTVEDLGAIELWGDITVEGEGFSISRPDLEVEPEGEAMLTVTFRPGATGNFDGTLTLESNDPVNPVVAIPLSGNGFDETGDTGENQDTGDGPDGEAGIRGCGCSSAPTGSLAWLALIPAFGFVLRRRR